MLNPALQAPDLKGRVAIITGSTRGIGKACAFALAGAGCNVVIAAKSVQDSPKLPGTIYSVAKEVEATWSGVKALPAQLDLRDSKSIERCVAATVEALGRIDILINNASALWWQEIKDTPINKYDLITSINTRGSFYMTKLCMEQMRRNQWGRVVCMSPPIQISPQAYKGFTAYNISKFGMTMVAMGAASEGEQDGILGFSLWPATVIESYASINFELGDRASWRKAEILSDCTLSLMGESVDFNGQQLIDDEYLVQRKGLSWDQLKVYRCDPNVEPPRSLATHVEDTKGLVKRGDVREVKKDMVRSKF